MNIDINPVHCEGLNCFEDILVTMASHYKAEYRLAFSDAWGFEFKPSNVSDSSLLGERIGNDVRNITGLLYKYSNINVVRIDTENPTELLGVIKEYLAQEIPLGLFIDAFWCPWLQGRYQRVHDAHHCLIIGMDEQNNFNCLDTALNLNISTLPYNDYINGCKNCVKYEFVKSDIKPDYLGILNESIKNLNKKKFYKDIKIFADEFKDKFDFSAEYRSFNLDVWYVLIDRNLRLIASGRTLYAQFIELISDKLHSDKLLDIKYELQKIASNWNKIRGILTKGYRKGSNDNVKGKVYSLLNEISNFEEELIKRLSQIDVSSLSDKNENILLEEKDINYFSETETIVLKLEDIMNNKAFAVTEADTYKADLSGAGHFFISSGLEKEHFIQAGSMHFRLPELVTKKYDNIACTGQEISVDKSVYHSIMFLGCSDNGDFIDEISLMYENGEELKIPISFADSWRLPLFKESIAWTGTGGKWTENRFEVHSNEQRIFAREELIRKKGIVEAIRLPYCPNIHIFAISLRKAISAEDN
ncbi:BtrH N-terminal domain-containing protein [Ruminiclostridium sufflavum]|nr:BtrH N-terminal domain-containing protein [Ruminiclostridium sufflavum]